MRWCLSGSWIAPLSESRLEKGQAQIAQQREKVGWSKSANANMPTASAKEEGRFGQVLAGAVAGDQTTNLIESTSIDRTRQDRRYRARRIDR
ncbi:MAG: hypothetical protein P0107_03215 [Nitrosomonas sp.]|nr:hypothetical protein [Nitrosomonas sp.]